MPEDQHMVLVVEDEPQIQRALRSGLMAQGYEVVCVSSGEEALKAASTNSPDMVILDIMLPGDIDGIEACRRLREWNKTVPILILSAVGSERQKVRALDLGADDYITKPFGMDELCARVRALLRRSKTAHSQTELPEPERFEFDGLLVDYMRRVVSVSNQEIKLTPIEYDILRYLTINADRVITHRQLLGTVWGAEYADETQLLRVHVGHVRQKIESDPARPKMIITEPGVGYRFRTS
jgi:two-component system KDP operon response regulator KdpE